MMKAKKIKNRKKNKLFLWIRNKIKSKNRKKTRKTKNRKKTRKTKNRKKTRKS